ncbi:MAG: hypothetical protein LBC58_06255 [Clostridiales Family XIII bacterium]|jgi:hypothetical protein|nr:hypothetical protein [Clostridiales Family XIII bacterium]
MKNVGFNFRILVKNSSVRKAISLLLIVALCLSLSPAKAAAFADSRAPEGDYLSALDGAQNHIAEITARPVVNSIGGEWAVLALARGGKMTGAIRDAYLESLRAALAEADSNAGGKVIFNRNKPTENERVILALTALGIDAADFEGADLVTPLTDVAWVNSQGINSTVFALIALDSKPYPVAESVRGELIAEITSAQDTETGDWSNSGLGVDMTAMAVQSLAPYYENDSSVRTAVDKAVTALSAWVQGNEADSAGASSESYAQIITALSALGIDAATDARFVNGDRNALTDFLRFALADGTFSHLYGDESNQMSTEQAAYTLVAYDRFKNGRNPLYDMTDAVPVAQDTAGGKEDIDSGNTGKASDTGKTGGNSSPVAAAPSETPAGGERKVNAALPDDRSAIPPLEDEPVAEPVKGDSQNKPDTSVSVRTVEPEAEPEAPPVSENANDGGGMSMRTLIGLIALAVAAFVAGILCSRFYAARKEKKAGI